jgi:hypothetical protein
MFKKRAGKKSPRTRSRKSGFMEPTAVSALGCRRETTRQHFGNVSIQSHYFGFVYAAVGKKSGGSMER